MSGYLQRIAMSVRKPGVAIHPVVGALFSTAQSGALHETFGDEDRASARDRFELLREAVSTSSHGQPELRPRSSAPASDDQSTASVMDAHSSAGSARSISRREGLVSSNRYDEGERRAESAKGDRETETINARRDDVPLIPTTLTPGPAVVTVPSTMPAADSTRHTASPSRPSDEIEIHIGRIEVTAVHPTPMRTAPAKPPRRAPSLDDYLKRRDGRPS